MFESSGGRVAVLDGSDTLDDLLREEPADAFFERSAGVDLGSAVNRVLSTGPGGWVAPIGVDDVDLLSVQDCADEVGTADPVAVLAALTALDPAALPTDFEVIELLAGLHRMASWVEAAHERVLLTFARRPMRSPWVESGEAPALVGAPGEVSREFVAEELAPRLAMSPRTVGQRLSLASQLVSRFPAAHAQRRTGRLDRGKAQILVRECDSLDDEACERIELRVLGRASTQSSAQFGRAVRRQVALLDPRSNEERHEVECERRYVSIEPTADGMAWLTAYLPADQALVIHTALTAAAARAKHDDPAEHRTLDQLRADLLAWPFAQALRTGALAGAVDQELARSRGTRPQIQVTVSAAMLMGLTDEPGELRGYGPIPASMARRIAAEGTWRRLVTDPLSGAVLDVGTTTYAPPVELLRHVRERDRTCRFPGCSRPAVACDVDHVVPYPHGPTADTNLAALCRRHHRFKHHDPDDEHASAGSPRSGARPAVHVEQPAPGTLHWRLPSGHRYDVGPERWN